MLISLPTITTAHLGELLGKYLKCNLILIGSECRDIDGSDTLLLL